MQMIFLGLRPLGMTTWCIVFINIGALMIHWNGSHGSEMNMGFHYGWVRVVRIQISGLPKQLRCLRIITLVGLFGHGKNWSQSLPLLKLAQIQIMSH